MSQLIDDVLAVLDRIRAAGRRDPASVTRVRIRAIHSVADSRGIAYQTVADAYIRRLRPHISNTAQFDRLAVDWLNGRPSGMRSALEFAVMDRGDRLRVDAFFSMKPVS